MRNSGKLLKVVQTTNVMDLCFPVEKIPMEDFGFNSISSTRYGIVANLENKKTILNTCSSRYKLTPNTDVFLLVEAILKANDVRFSVQYFMTDFSKFHAIYLLEDYYEYIGNDKIYLKFEITHSYNGLVQLTLIFGYWRMICSNGLVIPLKGHEDTNFFKKGKHTAKSINSINDLMGMLTTFLESKEVYSDRYKLMADRKVEKWEDRIIEVMNQTKIHLGGKGENPTEENKLAIFAVMNMELNDRLGKGKDVVANDWLIYNAINEGYIYNNKLNSKEPNIRVDLDQKVINWIFNNPIS